MLRRPPKAHLIDMLANMSAGRVAEYYGVTYSSLWRWKKYYNLSCDVSKDNHWKCKASQQLVEEIRKRVKAGVSYSQISKETGLATNTISEYCNYRVRV